jgi:phosphate/sulfate permease
VSGSVEEKSTVPIWILAMGGFGIVCGLTLYGYRVRHAHTRSRQAGAGG